MSFSHLVCNFVTLHVAHHFMNCSSRARDDTTPPKQHLSPPSPSSTTSDPASPSPTTPARSKHGTSLQWLQDKIKRLKRSPGSLTRPPILPSTDQEIKTQVKRDDDGVRGERMGLLLEMEVDPDPFTWEGPHLLSSGRLMRTIELIWVPQPRPCIQFLLVPVALLLLVYFRLEPISSLANRGYIPFTSVTR